MAPAPPQKVFGQTMHKKKKGGGGGRSNYQRQFGGSHKSNPSTVYRSGGDDAAAASKKDSAAEFRRQKIAAAKQVEAAFGIERFVLQDNQQSAERRGWLYNLVPTTVSALCSGCIIPMAALPSTSSLTLLCL